MDDKLSQLEQTLRKNPENSELRERLSRAYIQADRLQDARNVFLDEYCQTELSRQDSLTIPSWPADHSNVPMENGSLYIYVQKDNPSSPEGLIVADYSTITEEPVTVNLRAHGYPLFRWTLNVNACPYSLASYDDARLVQLQAAHLVHALWRLHPEQYMNDVQNQRIFWQFNAPTDEETMRNQYQKYYLLARQLDKIPWKESDKLTPITQPWL
jgi:hypothetical protein